MVRQGEIVEVDFRLPDDSTKKHPALDEEYGDLFEWHHILTGSCEFGYGNTLYARNDNEAIKRARKRGFNTKFFKRMD